MKFWNNKNIYRLQSLNYNCGEIKQLEANMVE